MAPVILLTGWGHQLSANNDVPEAVDLVLGKPPTVEGQVRSAIYLPPVLRQ